MAKTILPSTKEPIAGPTGLISATWYRLLAQFERLIYGAVTTTGTGLTQNAAGALTIADNGVSDAMLRDSIALSVMGRPLDSAGDPQDIFAAANGRFLQRDDDLVVFRYPRLPSFTVATVPSASDQGAGTMLFVSDESGGATIAFSDGANWLRVQDRAVIS